MNSDANKAVVRDFLEAMRDEDADRLRETLADDMIWWIPRSSGRMLNLPHPVRGADAVMEVIRGLLEGSTYKRDSDKRIDVHQLIGEDDKVMAFVTVRTVTAGGEPYENDYIYLSRLRDGKIAEQWEFTDTAEVFRKLGVTGA